MFHLSPLDGSLTASLVKEQRRMLLDYWSPALATHNRRKDMVSDAGSPGFVDLLASKFAVFWFRNLLYQRLEMDSLIPDISSTRIRA
jgi:hypothetical protein